MSTMGAFTTEDLMIRQLPITAQAMATTTHDIDRALSAQLEEKASIPFVTVSSAEHGPLVVMKATDALAILALVARPLVGKSSLS